MATHTHWKSLTNPNYLGSYAFERGQEMICTIKVVKNEMVTGEGGKKKECTVCYFTENVKPMILNKTNMKSITKLTGTPYVEEWAGHKIQIYVDPKVKFGRETTGGLRVREKVMISSGIKCERCGNDIKPAGDMSDTEVANYTRERFGKQICSVCARKITEEAKQNAN